MAADRDAPPLGFKRLNFFKGLVTTEADWIEREEFSINKLRMHTRALHGAGIVRGFLGSLAVVSRGDFSVEVQPGAAVDGRGNQMILWGMQVKNFSVDPKNDTVQYLVMRFSEQPTDFIAYKHNLAIRGHRRMLEACEIDVITKEPKGETEVELCRVLVEKTAKYIKDAKDPTNPKANEINTLAASHVGVAGSFWDQNMRRLTEKMFITLRGSLRALSKAKVLSAHNALGALLQAQGLFAVGMLDRRNIADVMWLVAEQLAFIYDDLVTNHSQLAQVKEKEMLDYYKHVKLLGPLVWKASASDAGVKDLYLNLQRAGDLMAPLAMSLAQTMIKPAPAPRRY
jgi:hypothetical protein